MFKFPIRKAAANGNQSASIATGADRCELPAVGTHRTRPTADDLDQIVGTISHSTRPASFPAHKSPEAHAIALVKYCRRNGYTFKCVLAEDMQVLHRQMCAELGWLERPWNPVAKAVTSVLGGKKLYVRVGGRRRRAYFFEVTAPSSADRGKA